MKGILKVLLMLVINKEFVPVITITSTYTRRRTIPKGGVIITLHKLKLKQGRMKLFEPYMGSLFSAITIQLTNFQSRRR